MSDREDYEDFLSPPTRRDLAKLADAFFENLQYDNVEFGGLGVDSKRPFGNSQVEFDIAEIIDVEIPDEEDDPEAYEETQRYCRELYFFLKFYLQDRWKELKK